MYEPLRLKFQRNEYGTYKVTTAPAIEPLGLSEVKNYLKVDNTVDDDLITLLIESARDGAEKYTNQGFLPQTVTEKFDYFPLNGYLRLSLSPLRAVTSVTYIDEDDVSQVLDPANYVVHTQATPPVITIAKGQTWPLTLDEAQTLTVVYTIGYDNAAAVPPMIRGAMLKMIATAYEKREESVKRLSTDVEQMLWHNRVIA
jgi:uncharacterized phiE125 gp8 family phage protein